MTRISLYRALFSFGILQIIAIFSLMLLAIAGKNYYFLISAIALDCFCNGAGTAALVAFLMGLCDQRYTATQFALLSAFSAISRVFVGPVAGVMAKNIGWSDFFIWAIIISIPGLILLKNLKIFIKNSAAGGRVFS